MRAWGLRGLALLLALGAAGCSCGGWEVSRQVTPWFRLEERKPVLELPHALVLGEHGARGSVLHGGQWHPVDVGGQWGRAESFHGGARVLLRRGMSEWLLLREGQQEGVALGRVCAGGPLRPPGDATLLCAGCLEEAGGAPGCDGVQLARFDADGRRLDAQALPLPEAYAGCTLVQLLPVGLLGEQTAAVAGWLDCPREAGREGPALRRVCALLAVDRAGVRTAVPPEAAAPCCTRGEWEACLGPAQRLTPRE